MYQREIERMMARRRQAQFQRQEAWRAQLADDPEAAEIERNLRAAGARYATASLLPPQARAEAEADFERLKRAWEIKAREVQNLYPEPPTSLCTRCQDTGYLENGRLCPCVIPELPAYLPTEVNFLPNREQSLQNFEPERFSSERSEDWYGGQCSPQDAALNMRAFAESYVSSFPEVSNLYIFGPPGTGKSYVLNALALALLERGYGVASVESYQYFEIMADRAYLRQRFQPDPEMLDINRQQLEALADADLLLLDDLGVERSTEGQYRELMQLIDRAAAGKQRLVIASNLTPAEFALQYDQRLASRLLGAFETIELMGPDLRQSRSGE